MEYVGRTAASSPLSSAVKYHTPEFHYQRLQALLQQFLTSSSLRTAPCTYVDPRMAACIVPQTSRVLASASWKRSRRSQCDNHQRHRSCQCSWSQETVFLFSALQGLQGFPAHNFFTSAGLTFFHLPPRHFPRSYEPDPEFSRNTTESVKDPLGGISSRMKASCPSIWEGKITLDHSVRRSLVMLDSEMSRCLGSTSQDSVAHSGRVTCALRKAERSRIFRKSFCWLSSVDEEIALCKEKTTGE